MSVTRTDTGVSLSKENLPVVIGNPLQPFTQWVTEVDDEWVTETNDLWITEG